MVEAINGTLCHIQGWQMSKRMHRNRVQEGQAPIILKYMAAPPHGPKQTKVD